LHHCVEMSMPPQPVTKTSQKDQFIITKLSIAGDSIKLRIIVLCSISINLQPIKHVWDCQNIIAEHFQ